MAMMGSSQQQRTNAVGGKRAAFLGTTAIRCCEMGAVILDFLFQHQWKIVNNLPANCLSVFSSLHNRIPALALLSLFSKTENLALILTDRSCIQNSAWVNICTSLFFGQTCWAVEGGGGPSGGLTGREMASARFGPSSPLGFKIGGEEKGLMLQACHRASAFISRFNARERRFILTHFIESIPRVMAKLLDCYGNCWEKRFLSVSAHVFLWWRCSAIRLYTSNKGRNAVARCAHSSCL